MTGNNEFVVGSASMGRVVAQLRKVAPLDTTVLLEGESGTGKELAARYLHDHHPGRRGGPFVSVHCGAIPDSLLESELFGHVRGAFTGAERDRVGKFELADGGTLFLDEISTMAPEAQVRLLRILQERRVTRVGAVQARAINVRVVVAANRSLKTLVDEGGFRLDLYYRVNTYPVTLPPLRERTADITPLLDHFGRQIARKLGTGPLEFSQDAIRACAHHPWPGNVRELANAVEYAAIQCEGNRIERENLPAEVAGSDRGGDGSAGVLLTEDGLSFRTAVTHLERDLILQSLHLAEGNKAQAAKLLDLKRTTFLEKLRKLEESGDYGIDQPERSSEDASVGVTA